MTTATIPFELAGFVIDVVQEKEEHLVISAHSTTTQATCPDCGTVTQRIHSTHHRQPHDLPSSGRGVRLHLHVPRFRCVNERCPRRTFVERIPAVVPFHAQRTHRLCETLKVVVVETGAEAGSRICRHLKMAASADTLLRITRSIPVEEHPTPRVLGVDDWALKKGRRYGTILVDLECHRTVDLLPERSADILERWLRDHPGVEVISRDRGDEYIQGASRGAPNALQIADRWHLLRNWNEALPRLWNRRARMLRQAAKQVQAAATQADAHALSEPELTVEEQPSYRLQMFHEVKRLAAEGHSQRAIARQLHLHRATVARYRVADELPRRVVPQNTSPVLPYWNYVQQRWHEGQQNARQLWHELQAQGFSGGYASVNRAVKRLRPRGKRRRGTATQQPSITLSPRHAAWLLVETPENLNQTQILLLEALHQFCPETAVAYSLAQRFVTMIHERQPEELDEWLRDAETCSLAAIRHFAIRLRQDYPAVRASLSFEWSNGQVEGQVNRLKTIKRQMYGRANFDLLRLRVLLPP
jgi:transposase